MVGGSSVTHSLGLGVGEPARLADGMLTLGWGVGADDVLPLAVLVGADEVAWLPPLFALRANAGVARLDRHSTHPLPASVAAVSTDG